MTRYGIVADAVAVTFDEGALCVAGSSLAKMRKIAQTDVGLLCPQKRTLDRDCWTSAKGP